MDQNTYTVTIDGVDYTKHVPMPVKWESLLDERLDEGRLSLKRTKTQLFQPLTPVTLTITDKKGAVTSYTMLVSVDDAAEIPVGSGFYNHEISLVEETKIAEGIMVETLTYPNDLGRVYAREGEASYTVSNSVIESKMVVNNPYQNAYDPKTIISIGSLKSIFSFSDQRHTIDHRSGVGDKGNLIITVTAPNGDKKTIVDGKQEDFINTSGTYSLSWNGAYYIDYKFNVYVRNQQDWDTFYITVTFSVQAVTNHDPLPRWNVASVTDRLLDLAIPHMLYAEPRIKFVLDESQRAMLTAIEAPEFAFCKMTLKECLDQIGGFIHGIPRIKSQSKGVYTVSFDMLGGTEQAELADPKYPYISNRIAQSVESYATALDSDVDNLVNILDPDEGVITEPYAGGYKTVRSEDAYARIEEGNMIISTQFPIYSVEKLEVGPLPDGSAGGDITAYVFEAADYGLLSSFEGGYPVSKAFAVYYEQGQKNIKGLNFKSPNVVGGAAVKYSIANIIEEVTGYNAQPTWWETIFDQNKVVMTGAATLMFRITYTPIFSARVIQRKTYSKGMNERTLAYNQGANLIETRYYGENMKGAIARTGNAEIERTYRLDNMRLLPKIGQMWGDDYYVSSVACALYPFYIDCTLGLSKDFNRLSQFIGINSMKRMYEVSEKQAYDRDMVYEDFVVIGDEELAGAEQLITESSGLFLAETFVQEPRFAPFGKSLNGSVSACCIETFDKSNADSGKVTLPVISSAMGNTLVFSWYMEDNYSAGKKSVKETTSGSVQGYWQTNVPYNDYYGRFDNMRLRYYTLGQIPDYSSDGSGSQFSLPEGLWGKGSEQFSTVGKIKVDKSSTEVMRFHYQLHYVTNRKGIVIGPALAHNCPLVRGIDTAKRASLYVLPNRLGKFTDKVDLTGATLVRNFAPTDTDDITPYRLDGESRYDLGFKIKDRTANASGAAWAIVDRSTGELLVGENVAVTEGQSLNLPNFTFRHNLLQ